MTKLQWLEIRADEMRQRPTGIEIFIYNLLDREGIDFEFQKPLLNSFIVDFYIPPNIVIETDGPHHNEQAEADNKRDATVRKEGICVLRIPYKNLNYGARYLDDYSSTWKAIKAFLREAGAREPNWNPSYDEELAKAMRNKHVGLLT